MNRAARYSVESRAALIVLCAAALIAADELASPRASFAADHLFVVTTDFVSAANCASLSLDAPWTASTNLEPVGRTPVVRHAFGLHYVVGGTPSDDLRIIAPSTFDVLRTISFDAGSNPQDVLVVGDGTAFVSFFAAAALLRVDLATGAKLASIDLSPFADLDGVPEMGRMIRDGNRVFVQLRRIDFRTKPEPQMQGALAVVNLTTNTLIDADPATPGTQAIELTGEDPRLSMQIEGRLLYVGEPGSFYNQTGGVEAVDLDTLEALGFAYNEMDMGVGQMSGFLLISPQRAYVIHHTDLTQSSHLVSFSRTTGTFLAEHFVTFGLTEVAVHDAANGLVFFPDNLPELNGIRVFDAATGDQLTSAPISTGLPPVDLVVARDEGTGAVPIPIAPALVTWAAPNPTRGAAWIRVLGADAPARLVLVDATGARMRTIAGEVGAGGAVFQWDGLDDRGMRVPAGVFFYRAENGAAGRVVVVR